MRDAGSIPATSTKVSKTLLGTFPCKDAGSKRFSGSVLTEVISSELDPFRPVLPEMLVNILIKFSSSGKLRITSPTGSKLESV
ncbi:MAG: hypothetical protein QNL65_00230 [Opitutales bacterium]